MATNESLEPALSLLLEPFPGKDISGESLRYTDVYDDIREARREDDENLPQGVWKTEIKKADWEKVTLLCQEALMKRSKDLQIAAWLAEAWLRLEGIGGLVRGLGLILGLTRNFWDEIHPQMNKKGYELRTVPYEWINARLSEDILCVLISMPSDHTSLPYRFLDYNEANRLEHSVKRNHLQGAVQHLEEKQLSFSKVSLSIDQTPADYYRYMDENCRLAIEEMTELEEELRIHLGGEAPAFYRLREKIDGLQRFARHVLNERGEKRETHKLSTETSREERPHTKTLSNPIQSREQAYAILGQVAAYLERAEPHSPTPYLIQRAIAWGGMTLSEVVKDTLHNGQDMSLLLDILDVKKEI